MLGWVQVFAVFLLKKDEGGAISVCCCFAEKGWGRCHLFGKHLGNNQTPTLIGSTCLVWPQCWELVRDGTFTQHCLFASSWVVSNLFAIIFDWAEDYGKPMVDFSWWLWGKDLRRAAPIFTNTFDQNKGGKTADSTAALGLGQVVWRGGEGLRETGCELIISFESVGWHARLHTQTTCEGENWLKCGGCTVWCTDRFLLTVA